MLTWLVTSMLAWIPDLDTGLEAGSCWKLEAGSWRLEAGGWRLEAGDWQLDDGGWLLESESWKLAKKCTCPPGSS
jgi:hypothetical protein